MPGLKQLPADELCCRFQRKHIRCARLILRQNDVSQRFALQFQTHQAAQIVLVRGQRGPGQSPALQPHAADGVFPIAVLGLQTEDPAFRLRPAALKAEAFLYVRTPQRCTGKILLTVTQKTGVPCDLPGKGRAGQILDMPHEIAFFIRSCGNEPAHGFGLWIMQINRTRHCSPARPADHP